MVTGDVGHDDVQPAPVGENGVDEGRREVDPSPGGLEHPLHEVAIAPRYKDPEGAPGEMALAHKSLDAGDRKTAARHARKARDLFDGLVDVAETKPEVTNATPYGSASYKMFTTCRDAMGGAAMAFGSGETGDAMLAHVKSGDCSDAMDEWSAVSPTGG